MPARSLSISSGAPKPLIVTLAPCSASARAMARPIPEVEPVTTAFLPFSMVLPDFFVMLQRNIYAGTAGHARPELFLSLVPFQNKTRTNSLRTGKISRNFLFSSGSPSLNNKTLGQSGASKYRYCNLWLCLHNGKMRELSPAHNALPVGLHIGFAGAGPTTHPCVMVVRPFVTHAYAASRGLMRPSTATMARISGPSPVSVNAGRGLEAKRAEAPDPYVLWWSQDRFPCAHPCMCGVMRPSPATMVRITKPNPVSVRLFHCNCRMA